MEEFKNYEECTLELNNIENRLQELQKTDIIKEYNRLKNEKHFLKLKQEELYIKKKTTEFDNCKHLFLNNKYCLKCNLSKEYFYQEYINYNNLNLDERIMFNYLFNEYSKEANINGTNINIDVQPSIAKAIYQKIKENYPEITDQDAIKYLKSSLYNMKYKDNNEKRNKSRLKRLSLEHEDRETLNFNTIKLDRKDV